MGITHHKALSVTSGYWIGGKGGETCIISTSGLIENVALSGIPSGKLTTTDGAVAIKLAGGTFGFSGWLKRSCSTGLTSIKWMSANEKCPWGFVGSGYYNVSCYVNVLTDWSGGTFDCIRASKLADVVTSATTSGSIAWVAMGT